MVLKIGITLGLLSDKFRQYVRFRVELTSEIPGSAPAAKAASTSLSPEFVRAQSYQGKPMLFLKHKKKIKSKFSSAVWNPENIIISDVGMILMILEVKD